MNLVLDLGALFLVGFLLGYYLENTYGFEYENWKKVFAVLTCTLGGTIVIYLFGNLINVTSLSLLTLWIGFLSGYYGSLAYKEIRKPRPR